MKAFTYWETSQYVETIPPYVLCGIASMQKVLGSDFLLLTRSNVEEHIDFDLGTKDFFFAAQTDKRKDDISRITARSDFIRFRYIELNGGVWVDADTVVLRDFLPTLRELAGDEKLAWHCEAFFGAQPRNEIVSEVAARMAEAHRQSFADPGGCKTLVREKRSLVSPIPATVWDPTGKISYKAETWELSLSGTETLEEFYSNQDCCIMKMYNSNLLNTDASSSSVDEFLSSDALIAKMFLSIEPDKEFWLDTTSDLRETLGG